MKVPELYFSVPELSMLLKRSEDWVRKQVKASEFGPLGNILSLDGDLRIPASGVNFFTERHTLEYDPGIKARNLAELRRRMKKEEAPS